MSVGKSGVGPADAIAAIQLIEGRFNQFGPADFLKALGREPCDDQLASFIEHPDTILVLDKVNRTPTSLGGGCQVFPDTCSGGRIEAAQLTIAVDTVEVALEPNWRTYDRVQPDRIAFVAAHFSPQLADCQLLLVQPQHHRAVIK